MPFVKLDCGFLESSLWPDHIASRIFLAALLMAYPEVFDSPIAELESDGLEKTGFTLPAGWYGFVPAAGPGIIGRARIGDSEGYEALRVLAAPDNRSRSDEYGGRRLVRVSGGYIVLNYMKYREKDNTSAERQRRFREKRKKQPELIPRHAVTPLRNAVTSRYITQAEAEAEAEKKKSVSVAELCNHPAFAVVLAYFNAEMRPAAERFTEPECRQAWRDFEMLKDADGNWYHWYEPNGRRRKLGDWRAGFEDRLIHNRERKDKPNGKHPANHPPRPTRNDGTLNAGKASQYRGVGRVVQLPDNGGTAT